ncbi:Uncharacterized ACR, COG1399 [Aliiroseovarius sediminilitoris]|uniref:Uncharacterized ACR, COG1399 n=1 Tax=Aliiroseovarius sediminilitoris TaxID=1173584 RepID=A0A1I0Q469_9RHOB|nr:DUF177 domain-containing protein [Aliiroseovarius sediminilitoris]SEW21781.1 Uncharacterized ACR, COG1399 [Aliiroseovarius sediminilitoris]
MTDTTPSGDALPFTHPIRVADLPTGRPTQFELVPDQAACDAIADDLGITGVRKLRFTGQLKPLGKHDWQMAADLGATVVQDCVVTLNPVTTRIDDTVERRWLSHFNEPAGGEEVEMPEDDSVDALRDVIDLGQVMIEALALALPLYPRVEGAEIQASVFAEPGTKPMTDDDAKPFAGLSELRDRLSGKDK